ncbi:MAG: hypothetical protein ACLTBD_09220 [Clostridia bacterium]
MDLEAAITGFVIFVLRMIAVENENASEVLKLLYPLRALER